MLPDLRLTDREICMHFMCYGDGMRFLGANATRLSFSLACRNK